MSFERIKRLALFPAIAIAFSLLYLVFPPPQQASAADARVLIFSEAVADPGSLADGAGVSNDIAAEGAALGDACIASTSIDIADATLTCNITAANVATTRLQNESAGAIDYGAYTTRVYVFKSNAF